MVRGGGNSQLDNHQPVSHTRGSCAGGGFLSWTVTRQYLTLGGGGGVLAGQSPASISRSEGGWSGEDFLTEQSPDSISHWGGGGGGGGAVLS